MYPDDEFLEYDLDKSVKFFTEYFDIAKLNFEQIDDDYVEISGQIEFFKSMNHNQPYQVNIRSRYLDKSYWKEGPFRITYMNMCPEFLNSAQPWYNITKLWTSDVCPPEKGVMYNCVLHIINYQILLFLCLIAPF